MEDGFFLHLGSAVYLSDRGTRKKRNPIGFQNPKEADMGHSYRTRHTVASTTTDGKGGLKTDKPKPTASWTDDTDWTELRVADLRDAATERGLDSEGTKAELIERLQGGK